MYSILYSKFCILAFLAQHNDCYLNFPKTFLYSIFFFKFQLFLHITCYCLVYYSCYFISTFPTSFILLILSPYMLSSVSHAWFCDSVWPYGIQPASSSVHRILQARILQYSFSFLYAFLQGIFWARDLGIRWTHLSYLPPLVGGFSTPRATWEALIISRCLKIHFFSTDVCSKYIFQKCFA